MATEYTSIFQEKDVSFEEFVWRCARGMTAFSHMKKKSASNEDAIKKTKFLDAPLEMPIINSNRLELAKKEKEKYANMTLEEARENCLVEHNIQIPKYQQDLKQALSLRKRYSNMLEKINEWFPPSDDFLAFKDFMIVEITSAIESDCKEDVFLNHLNTPIINYEIWLAQKITKANRSFDLANADYSYEMSEHLDHVRWISLLRDSVSLTEPIQE